jgi:hypothetical protein
VRGKSLSDVLGQLSLHGIAGEFNIGPDVRVSKDESSAAWFYMKKNGALRDGNLESIVGMTVFPVQGPGNLLV